MGSARWASSSLLLAALATLASSACRRRGEPVVSEVPADVAAPSTSTTGTPGAGPGLTLCRDGQLFDHEGRGLSLRSGDPRDPHEPLVDAPAVALRDARVSLYGTVATIGGPLSELQVARETCRAYARQGACFVEEMKTTPALSGTLELAVTVAAEGNVVATTRREGTLAAGSLVGCLAAALAELRFPAAAAPTSFVYSLRARTHPLLGAQPIRILPAGVSVTGPGAFDQAALLAIVVANMAPLDECYERGLETDATLHGDILLAFDVDASGVVGHVVATAGTSMPDPKVNSCVIAAIGRLVFPAPKGGGISVRIPLELTSAKQP